MIRINTNENYFNEDLNVILENNNKDLNEFILNIGTLIVKNIDIINNFPTINSNTKEIEKYQDIIHGLYQKISIIDNQNHKNIQNLINNFEKNNFVSENDNLKYKIDDLETKLANKNNNDNFIVINDKISLIENKFQIFLDRFSKGNTEKGNFGEKFIQNYIKDKFFNSEIIDTHKETSYGDMFFKYNDLNTLIESKNVQNLKKEDFSKFYFDVELRANNKEINSALFISLTDSNLINNSKYFVLDYKFNIPIIYISHVFNNPEFIRFSIIILENLLKNMNYQHDQHLIQDFFSQIEIISNLIVSHFDYINSDKKLISKLQININNRENDLNNINSKILKLIQKNSKYDYNYIDNIINHLNKNKDFKINIKNLNSIGINKNAIIELGGIKEINKKIKEKKNIIL